MQNKIVLDLDYFENIVLYKILTDVSYLNLIIDKLDEKYIHNKDNREVYKLIKAFFTEKNKIPTAAELKQYLNTDALKNSFSIALNRIKNLDKNISNEELYQNTDRFLKERGISSVVWEYAQGVSDGKTLEPSLLLEQVEKVCNISINTDMGLDLFNDTNKIIEYLNNPCKHISTGWKWLDNAIKGGWLANGNALYTVYGKPNIGKSIVLGNLADNVAKQGYTVLLITLEMNEMSYAERLLSRITQINNNDLTKDVDLFKQKLEENKKGRILIKEFGTSTITPFELESFIEKVQKTGIKIDFIVIDYLDLLVWPGNIEDWKALTKIAERLRGMSKKLQIPVLTASQISRCLTLDTIVKTPTGDKQMKDLKVGDSILSTDKYVTVKHIYPIEKQQVYKIKLKSGKEIKCSANHIFPTNKGMCTIEKGLKIGDKLQILK